jgi:hypothetical protein
MMSLVTGPESTQGSLPMCKWVLNHHTSGVRQSPPCWRTLNNEQALNDGGPKNKRPRGLSLDMSRCRCVRGKVTPEGTNSLSLNKRHSIITMVTVTVTVHAHAHAQARCIGPNRKYDVWFDSSDDHSLFIMTSQPLVVTVTVTVTVAAVTVTMTQWPWL